MRSAVDERQTALEGTGAQLVRSLQHGQRLSQLAHELLGLVGALSGAVMSGAEACAAHAAASAAAAAGAGQGHGPPGAVGLAQQLSSLVDLPAEDIEALLEEPRQAQRSASSRSGVGTSGQGGGIPALVQEAGRLVEQLHAGFDAGGRWRRLLVWGLVCVPACQDDGQACRHDMSHARELRHLCLQARREMPLCCPPLAHYLQWSSSSARGMRCSRGAYGDRWLAAPD